jgi:hypothetical protein
MEENEKNIKIEDSTPKTDIKPKMRQIIIETDGNDINLVKAEVSGFIELRAIFQNLIGYINSKSNK